MKDRVPASGKTSPSALFRAFIEGESFPCVGARSSLAQDHLDIVEAGDLYSPADDRRSLAALQSLRGEVFTPSVFRSVAIIFAGTRRLTEAQFETALWRRLQALHELDRATYSWNESVGRDPRAPDFAMSFGGVAYYVVGMHPGASRLARRSPHATLVFNPHEQFRLLREEDLYGRMQSAIRARELELQGSVNPMLAEHGVRSEAIQYSGRKVDGVWTCPFKPGTGTGDAH